MRPCTPHFVLGTEDSIVLGRHYYATTTIRRSCFGIVHTFVMGAGITNTSHNEDVSSLLRQLMALWYRHMVLHDGFGSKYSATTQCDGKPDLYSQERSHMCPTCRRRMDYSTSSHWVA